jgi:hypothetical protein
MIFSNLTMSAFEERIELLRRAADRLVAAGPKTQVVAATAACAES